MQREVKESDWKLFRSRLPGWQEAYMEKLLEEYREMILGDSNASDRFWALAERINQDQKSCGVQLDMRRSLMYRNLYALLATGVISKTDLDGFSDELRECIIGLYASFA